MHQRIFNAEIFYIFGKAKQEEIEPIFAALVAIEDEAKTIIRTNRGNFLKGSQLVETLRAKLKNEQPLAAKNFIKRMLQVDAREAMQALDLAINHVFTMTEHYNSAITNHKSKLRIQQEKITHG